MQLHKKPAALTFSVVVISSNFLPLPSVPRNLSASRIPHVGPMLRRFALDLRGERAFQFVEVERLLKVSYGTQICAVFLVFRIQFAVITMIGIADV
jgi:hypothetical protein